MDVDIMGLLPRIVDTLSNHQSDQCHKEMTYL